jgi:diguanylate cyclase (GGDEF)-like protein
MGSSILESQPIRTRQPGFRKGARATDDRRPPKHPQDGAEFMAWFRPIQRQKRTSTKLLFGGALFSVFAIVGIDLWLPATFRLDFLLILPVLLAAWFLDLSKGLYLAGCAVAIGTAAKLLGFGDTPQLTELCWEAGTQFAVLSIVAGLTSRWRASALRAEDLARRDLLTGLANAQAFRDSVEAETNRCRRNGFPLTVAYLDCDGFKQVNDSCGHAAGDRLLCKIAETLRENTRNYDVVARMGGDEFALLFPETSAQDARTLVTRIRAALRNECEQQTPGVSLSMGVLTLDVPDRSSEEIIHAADRLMYTSKRGRPGDVEYSVVPAATERAATEPAATNPDQARIDD